MAAQLVCSQLDLFTHGALALDPRHWSQLDLFTHGALALDTRGSCLDTRGADLCWMNDRERDRRSGGQWIRAVKSYLEFGTGDAWRRLSDPEQRCSPERDWYLSGIRTINGIPSRDGRAGVANLPVDLDLDSRSKAAATARAQNSPVEKLMAARSRGWIVDELLRVNLDLTDKKLLLRLSHIKLAGMLLSARRGVSSAARPAGKKQRFRIPPKQPKSVVPLQSFPAALRGAA